MRANIRNFTYLHLIALALVLSSCSPASRKEANTTAQPLKGSQAAKALDSWHTGFSEKFNSIPFPEGTEVPNTHFFEIPLSKFEDAEQLLEHKQFVKIQNGYFGQFPQCPEKSIPYLTRAVFERNTGTFIVHAVGSELFVMNASLGPAVPLHRSALVVCLGFEPSAAYTEINGAM